MYIISLKLENTKSHASAEFDFTDGINAIVGQNGAGKSTLLEAIGFTLFGYLAYNQSDFIREGEKTATITVAFRSGLDSRRYEVIRRIGGSSQYYAFDPELDMRLCEGGTDVEAFLKEHMQVDPNASLETLFNDAVGVPQGTLTTVFALTATKRRGTFDKLLQVEEYEIAAKKLNEPQKVLREQIKEFDLKVTELQTRLERLPQLEEAAQARQKKVQKAEKDVAKVDKALEKILGKRSKLDEVQQELTSNKGEESRLMQQVESILAQLDSAQKAAAESEKAQTVVKQNQAAFDAYTTAQNQQQEINAKQQERQQLDAACNQIERAMAQTQSQLALLTKQLEEIATAETLIQTLEPKLKKQAELEQKRDTVQRQSMQHAEIKRAAAEQDQRLQEIQAQKERLLTQQSAADKIHKERTQADATLKDARALLVNSQEEMARYKIEAETVKNQTALLESADTKDCPVCEQTLTAAHRDKMITRNSEHVAVLRTSYSAKQKAQADAESQIQTIEKQIRAFDQQLQQLPRPEEIERLEKQALTLAESLKESAKQIEQFASVTDTAAKIEKELENLGNPRQETAIANQKAAQRPTLESNQTRAQEEVDTQKQELSTHQKALKQLTNLEGDVAAIMAKLQAHQAGYQAVIANQNTASALQDRLASIKALQSQQKENTKAQSRVAKTLEKLEKKFDPAIYQSYQEEERTLRAQQATIQAQLHAFHEENERSRHEIEALQKYQVQLNTIQQRRQKVEKELSTLDMVRKLLRQAGPYITRALIHQVSNGAEQIFGDLMQDYSRRLVWNEDYGISLEVDGRERQFVQLSGGEQMSAALSVRLALLREMSNIDVAFFDEPTTNLDEMRRESLAKQILEVKGFRQLFVISHDDTFEQSTENIIRVERQE